MRAARASEMEACAKVFHRSINDLSRRQGGRPRRRKPADLARRLRYLRASDPKGFQVALKDGEVAAFASTILREDVHFLSMFWALPSLQGKGIGQALLARAFNKPDPPATAVRCVCASLDPRAQALYLRMGMVPRSLVYWLMSDGEVRKTPPPDRPLELVQVGEPGRASREALALAAAVDRKVRGCRRDGDIAFSMSSPGARFFEARERGDAVGYVVVERSGLVGPGGVIGQAFTEGLAWAGIEAARAMGCKKTSFEVLGSNEGALRVGYRAGLKHPMPGAWMTQREFGKLDCYFGTNGDLF
jgi:GNAT superfamily N-acetyltransferase